MKIHTPTLTEFVILPEVMLAMVYVILLRVWSVWAFTTHHIPGTNPGDPTLVSNGQLAAVTLANVLFLALFALAIPRVRKGSPSLRKGHYASLIVGAFVLVLLQVAAFQGHAQFGVYGFPSAGN
ncbi:MAG: hypothetical protein P1V35_16045 [Planctomycetota bacterium]|nr:hypothetical protein [Planctomycetota bacterium]